MSRRKSDQIEFGSDSFLDIIANIVGILIILIVLAGLRVSQAPVSVTETVEEPAQIKTEDLIPEMNVIKELEIPEPEKKEVVENPEPIIVKADPIEPDPELQLKIQELKSHLANYEEKFQKQKLQFKLASMNSRKVKANLVSLSSTRTSAIKSVKKSRSEFRHRQKTLNRSQKQVEGLKKKLAELDNIKAPAHQIKHHFSPVSKEVHGEELHFRLANNQIAHVPLEDLLDDLKKQIYRKKDWLVKFNQHQGEVGPIDGFSLVYIVRRERLSVLDELQTGRGTVRIEVKEWVLNTEDNLQTEDAKTALTPGSKFLNSIQRAGNNATLTFWVYPDSYSIYRKIKTYAHHQYFQVAARPLPYGVPIAGSPSGSKSSGQ